MARNWALTQFQIGELFGNAYGETVSIERAVKDIEICNIFPYNFDVFSKEDFAPDIVTDQPDPNQVITNMYNSIQRPNNDEEENLPLSSLKKKKFEPKDSNS